MRAVHTEIAESLSTTSFINALRRVIAGRGQGRYIHCDRGTNLMGAQRESGEAMNDWNQSCIHGGTLLLKNIDWKVNPHHASHFGGVWERQIRTVRKVLNGVMKEQALTDEALSTLMCEGSGYQQPSPVQYFW